MLCILVTFAYPMQEYHPLHQVDSEEFVDVESVWAGPTDKQGNTQLHLAAAHGDNRTLEKLLATGFFVETKNKSGKTALHCAAGSEYGLNCVVSLVSAGANINPQDNYGRTPLACAIAHGRTDIVDFLISVGAIITEQALDLARHQNDEIYNLLFTELCASKAGLSLLHGKRETEEKTNYSLVAPVPIHQESALHLLQDIPKELEEEKSTLKKSR